MTALGSTRSSNQFAQITTEVGGAAIRTRHRATPSPKGRFHQLRSFVEILATSRPRDKVTYSIPGSNIAYELKVSVDGNC